MNYRKIAIFFLTQLLFVIPLVAQDLDPRAYARVPVGLFNISANFSYAHGEVLTDATLPIQNIKATVHTPSIGIVHVFSLFNRTSQVLVAVPYSWAKVTGDVGNQSKSVTRSGFSDMRLRFSILLLGAPAVTTSEFAKAPRKTVLGISLNIVAPTGQFFPEKLINLGANRFSFRPEIALSQPFMKRMLFDLYAGIWFFTDNTSFYPGNSVRSQQSMTTFQAHISYNINTFMWVALDGTYYMGGKTSVNNIFNDDRQSNSRIGFTALAPLGKRSAIKISYSTGAVVRAGQNFDNYSIGLQTSWTRKTSKEKTLLK